MPVKFPWKQHDFGKNVHLFVSVLHTERERATECKSKEQNFKKNHFYQSTQFSHSSQGWVKYPRRCISGVMRFTFAMLTCNDVHKLELWIFIFFFLV